MIVVGIGASAGGLEALEQFFGPFSAEIEFAFVIIQHLDPNRPSMLRELLGRRTALPVVEASDGTVIQPGHIYTLVPGTSLGMSEESTLRVTQAEAGQHDQVDLFFTDLAQRHGHHAVGIILSGMGSDGTSGLRAIKQQGGFTLVQAPETAKYDSMPRNAIDAGLADQVLPIEKMPERLIDYARRAAEEPARDTSLANEDAHANSDLQNLFASNQVATLFLDKELRIARFTPAATEMFHLRESDVGRRIVDFASFFDSQSLPDDARKVLETLNPVERQVHSAHQERWFILRLLPYLAPDKRVSGVVVTFVDVTELKHTEEALRASEERQRLIVENISEGIVVSDAEGHLIHSNRAAIEMHGMGSLGEAKRHVAELQSYFALSTLEGAPISLEQWPLSRALRGELIRGLELRVLRLRTGDERIFSYSGNLVRNGAGRIVLGVMTISDITERKNAEEALLESGRWLRVAQETAGAGTWEWNLTTGKSFWSDQLWKLYGLPKDSLRPSYDTWLEAIIPEDREMARELVRTAAKNVSELTVEFRTKWPDGAVHYMLMRGLPQLDESGHLEKYLGIVLDITQRRAAEELGRASEERFRALVSATSDAVYRMNPDWSELYQLSGRDFVESTEKPERDWLNKYIPPSDQQRVMEAIREAVRAQTVFQLEHRVFRKDHSLGWTLSRAIPIKNMRGEVVEWFGAASDVTTRKEAAEDLERSRKGLSQLAQASLSVIAKTDLEGMLQSVAEAALKLVAGRIAMCTSGFASQQYIAGRSARVPGAPPCPRDAMLQPEKCGARIGLLVDKRSVRLTDAELRSNPLWQGLPKNHVPLRGLLGVSMLARNGKPNGMILVTDKESGDFTAEDEVLLSQLATVASLAIQHVEARISLEESDRRKSQFLAVLSHELRNPLSPIRNSLFILDRAEPGGEQARRAYSVIDRQVGHLTRLVEDLLDVTRISRGKIQLQREQLDLRDLVRRAVDDYNDAFARNNVTLELALSEKPLIVDADRTRIAQVIGNMLSNSTKFTPPGGKTTVSLEADRELGQAILLVRDTGIGINAEMLPRVFEAFSQADTTLDRSKGGLGLGLALVKGLVEMHGGSASVRSEGAGKGAEFSIRLPLIAEQVAPTQPEKLS